MSTLSSTAGESSKRRLDDPPNGAGRDGKKAKVKKAPQPTPALDEDDEWARFQQEVMSAPVSSEEVGGSESGSGPTLTAPATTYVNATIEVQPELRRPPLGGEDHGQQQGEAEETEAQKRRRLAKEENEEIFARLEEERRLQDEAEERVSSLKSRLERIKAARVARQSSRTKVATELSQPQKGVVVGGEGGAGRGEGVASSEGAASNGSRS